MLEGRERHFGPITTIGNAPNRFHVDAGALVRRLILFEHCYLESVNLEEIPILVDIFGYAGMKELLLQPGFEIIDDRILAATRQMNGSVGHSGTIAKAAATNTHDFVVVSLNRRPGELPDLIKTLLQRTSLSESQRGKLRALILAKLVKFPSSISDNTLETFKVRMSGSPYFLSSVLEQIIPQELHINVKGKIKIEIREAVPLDGKYIIDTNLHADFGIDEEVAYEQVAKALRGTSSVDLRMEMMAQMNAVTGFREEESLFVTGHFATAFGEQDPEKFEEQFTRVVQLGELPSLENVQSEKIDMGKLLDLRNSKEAVDLRRWLRQSTGEPDDSIAEQFGSIKERLASYSHSKLATSIRFLATNAAGMIHGVGLVLGPLATAADKYLIDTVLGQPGPVTYLSRNYPSIFKE